jgi:hypothetical protein
MLADRSPGSCRARTRPPAGAARALEYFWQHILQHRFVQCQASDQLLQPGVLFLELLELIDLIDLQSNAPLFPSIKALFRDSSTPDQLRQRHPGFGLLQDGHKLFYLESLLLRRRSPFSGQDFAGNQPLQWIKNTGTSQICYLRWISTIGKEILSKVRGAPETTRGGRFKHHCYALSPQWLADLTVHDSSRLLYSPVSKLGCVELHLAFQNVGRQVQFLGASSLPNLDDRQIEGWLGCCGN